MPPADALTEFFVINNDFKTLFWKLLLFVTLIYSGKKSYNTCTKFSKFFKKLIIPPPNALLTNKIDDLDDFYFIDILMMTIL